MREKCITTEYGSVYYWLSDIWNEEKETIFFFPGLIKNGEYDKTGKVRYYCKIWHEQTNYPLQIIKGAGHNANVDNPEEMNFIINEFLEEKVLGNC